MMNVEIPTTVAGTLEYATGAVISMMMTFDAWGHDLPHLQLHGTKGSISVGDPNNFGARPRFGARAKASGATFP